jgi:hypothetical protein
MYVCMYVWMDGLTTRNDDVMNARGMYGCMHGDE